MISQYPLYLFTIGFLCFMLIYYYYPFERPDLTDFKSNEFEYQRKKDNVVIHIVKETLFILSKYDRLYIVAHGNTAVIGAGRTRGPVLTPLQLAYLLAEKKLPKNFIDLRLLSCDSGVSLGCVPAYSQRLKECMLALGYYDLKITGYIGKTVLQRNYRLKNTEEADFWPQSKKGIKPHKKYSDLIKSPFGIDESFYYAASDFKKEF